jgi:diguanylate cyclase (GGDEF)-like protein
VTGQGKGRPQIVRGPDRRRKESAIIIHEAAILGLEKAVTAREDAADRRELEISTKPGPDNQMAMLQQANAHLVISSIEAHKMAEQIQMAKDQLDHLAHFDVLTGLPNRVLLYDRLEQAIDLARRQKRKFAVMFMDLDKFKNVNDSLGHTVGDLLLQSVAQCMIGCVRQSDTISRQGGDEFVLLLSTIERAEDAALCAQKLLTALALPHHIDRHDLHIGASIGISIYPDDGQDMETLTKNADTAMYHAKENGRNHYQFFEPNMNVLAVRRQSIEASLRHALERREFVLHYQPKINLQTGTIVGVEALIRWQHPVQGLLLPAQFIDIAEDCGLILPIGRWVLREACLQAQVWRQAGLPKISVAVNTSSIEFRAQDFLDNICATLKDTCLEPSYLELEVTESVLMRDVTSVVSVLQALADLGVKLAIDDFGTGYSSLSYLKRFPIDHLKIDQSFVNQLTSNPDDASIVIAVLSLGNSLKKRVIAEGVETAEQYTFLKAQHCDEGQGYYFCRPVTAEVLTTLLQTGLLFTTPE